MDWLLQYHPADGRVPTEPGIPKRLLRRLVRNGNISIGSRVLDAGCGRGELTRFLDELAVEASGFDESAACIAAAQAAAGHLSYACSRAAVGVPFPERSFDVVLARDLPDHRGNLFDFQAMRATAHLLATIRPQGRLIIVRRVDAALSNQPGGHLQTCYLRHLESFPGVSSVSYLADSLLDATTWKWMMGRQSRAGFMIALLALPDSPRTKREWEQIADEAALRRRQACCVWGAQAAKTREPFRTSA
ncbi:MAG: class I SAM-dependent methyltransferase [Deltaproteobacteria bacterium]